MAKKKQKRWNGRFRSSREREEREKKLLLYLFGGTIFIILLFWLINS